MWQAAVGSINHGIARQWRLITKISFTQGKHIFIGLMSQPLGTHSKHAHNSFVGLVQPKGYLKLYRTPKIPTYQSTFSLRTSPLGIG